MADSCMRQLLNTLLSAFALASSGETSCCGRKKLPFAGYSIVKDRSGGTIPRSVGALGIAPPDPLARVTRGALCPAPFRSRELFILPAAALTCKRDSEI